MGDNLRDEDGVIHERGWNGQYRPKQGLFGPKYDRDTFGRPRVARTAFGTPKAARTWWGGQRTSSSGVPLYEGGGSDSPWGLILLPILLIVGAVWLGFMMVKIYVRLWTTMPIIACILTIGVVGGTWYYETHRPPPPQAPTASTLASAPPENISSCNYMINQLPVTVQAAAGWQAVGTCAPPNTRLVFHVIEGLWSDDPNRVSMTSGQGNAGSVCAAVQAADSCTEPLPDFPKGALIGRVGDQTFGIGHDGAVVIQGGGQLFLRINDDDATLADSTGSLVVKTSAPDGIPFPTSIPPTVDPVRAGVNWFVSVPPSIYDTHVHWADLGCAKNTPGHPSRIMIFENPSNDGAILDNAADWDLSVKQLPGEVAYDWSLTQNYKVIWRGLACSHIVLHVGDPIRKRIVSGKVVDLNVWAALPHRHWGDGIELRFLPH